MHQCINLKECFGDRFRITFDPAYDFKGVHHKDPWYMQIPCKYGIIYPFGNAILCVEIDYHNQIAHRVAKIPGVVCHQEGEFEKSYIFHTDVFESIAELVHPRMRRRMTEEQKLQLATRGREALSKLRKTNDKRTKNEP